MAGANVAELTTANWESEVVKSDKPVLVDFSAAWCGPCRQLAPIIDRVAEQFAGRVKVGKVDVDDNQDLATKYGVMNIPRVLIFKGGDQPVRQMVGLQSEREIVNVLNNVLEVVAK
jgi:thioredoxin 1